MGVKGKNKLQKLPQAKEVKGRKEYIATTTSNEEKSILDDLDFTSSTSRSIKGQRKKSSIQQKSMAKQRNEEDDFVNDPYWSPMPYSAFKLLISARFAAALWTTISDCDETFNYWEPTHYLLYGKGFQTWEYSPIYALRSYTYILLHAVPAKLYDYFLKPTPLLIFFFIRCFLSFICACSEAYLYRAVRKKFGGNVARIILVTSLFSAGMFISSCAYLPSSFSGYMTAFAFGAWLDGLDELAIFAVALSGLLSWPFAALTGAVIAFDIVFIRREILMFLKWSILSFLVIMIPVVVLDTNLYGNTVVAPWNIVMYNIFSNKGPELYGTESWSFYLVNGTLNFSLVFPAAILSPFFVLSVGKLQDNISRKMVIIGTIYLWLGVFLAQPHKEERFLFPIYPLLPVAGGIGIDALQKLVDLLCSKAFLYWIQGVKDVSKLKLWDYRKIVTSIGVASILTSSVFGCSRILALHYGYRAPFDLYFHFHRDPGTQKAIESGRNYTVCYGKEWHRFPSSFFIPSLNWDVRFIKSEFEGQLPSLYPALDPDGTKRIPEYMNDLNKEETSRYVDVSQCHYLVDLVDPSRVTPNEPNYSEQTSTWKIVTEQKFLNAEKSNRFYRAFYIPWISAEYTTYNSYVLLKRVKKGVRPKRRGKEFFDDDIL